MKEERNTYKGEKRFKSLSKIEVDVIIHQELDDKGGLNFLFVYYISIMLLVPTGLLVTEENIFWRRVDSRVDTGIFLARSLSIQMYVGCIEPQYKLWQEENRICL